MSRDGIGWGRDRNLEAYPLRDKTLTSQLAEGLVRFNCHLVVLGRFDVVQCALEVCALQRLPIPMERAEYLGWKDKRLPHYESVSRTRFAIGNAEQPAW